MKQNREKATLYHEDVGKMQRQAAEGHGRNQNEDGKKASEKAHATSQKAKEASTNANKTSSSAKKM